MLKTFITKLKPTESQKEYLEKCFNYRRFIWNYCLNRYMEEIKNNKISLSKYDMCKHIVQIRNKEEFKWMNEMNNRIHRACITNLYSSITRYWNLIKSSETRLTSNYHRPKYIKKKDNNRTFKITDMKFKIKDNYYIGLPRTGSRSTDNHMYIKCTESIKFINQHDFKEFTIKKEGSDYYIYIVYDEKTNHHMVQKNDNNIRKVGIDMGMKTFLTCVDDTGKVFTYHEPKSLKRQEKRTKRRQRIMDRKVYGSKSYEKARLKFANSLKKESNIKKDHRKKIIKELYSKYDIINIEPFNFKTYKGIRAINRSKRRLTSSLFLLELEVSNRKYPDKIVNVIQFQPTTQTCSCCGNRYFNQDKLTLTDREYVCTNCGLVIDRDENSARNILALA